MYDKAFDDSQLMLKLIPDLLVTSKTITELYAALYADESILHFDDDSDNVVFSCNKMSILNIDINKVSLDNNFDEDDPDTIILISLLAGHVKFLKGKAFFKKKKISKELMPEALYPKRW